MRRSSAALLLVLALAAAAVPLRAQEYTGSIQGTVTDKAGKPLVGATVYLASPSLQGMKIYVVGKSGTFEFPALPAGPYRVTAEQPGFETLVQDRVPLFTGMSFFVPFALGASEVDVETQAPAAPPEIDAVSGKHADVIDQSLIRLLPLARTLGDVLALAPGVVATTPISARGTSIQGGTSRQNAAVLDGATFQDPFDGAMSAALNIDQIEEIEIATAGLPATRPHGGGGYLNIVTKSGGNGLTGSLGFYAMNDKLNSDLWTPAEVQQAKTGVVSGDKGLFDGSFNLGGALWPDRAWFFLGARYARQSEVPNFLGPYTDTFGRTHTAYDWYRQDIWTFFKATVHPIPEAKGSIWMNVGDAFQPVAGDLSPRLPFISTQVLNHETNLAFHAVVDYTMGPNTQAYARASYVQRHTPLDLQSDALSLPYFTDAGSLYGALTGAAYSSDTKRERIQAEAAIRTYTADFLGAAHSLTVGFDFEDTSTDSSWWRLDNLAWAFDSRNANGSYYGDHGLLGFWNCGTSLNDTYYNVKSDRLGFYAADQVRIGRRLSLDLGLRFDWAWGLFPAGAKGLSGNALSTFIGDAYIAPYVTSHYPDDFAANYNPYNAFATNELSGVISWTVLSPRLGFAYDLFGTGRTIVRGSFARTADDLSQRYFASLNPLYPRLFPLNWYDTNANGQPDAEDDFQMSSMDLRMLSGGSLKPRVASDITAPATRELAIGVDQEISRDFTLGLHYISKTQVNILEDVLYAPDTGEYWYDMSQAAAQKYWVPFTTTVPGNGTSAAQTVTIYGRSLSAPKMYYQLRNVPELTRTYSALELSFHKRLSDGWQLAGSAVFSKAQGNIGTSYDETTGLTAAGDSPNYFINRSGVLDADRPVQIKLMGSIALPLGTWLSAFFQYQSGIPWQRTAQILLPAAWCAANKVEQVYTTVALDTLGSHRTADWANLDLRLQKDWRMGATGKLEMFVDVNNVLGATTSLVGLNDVDRWLPAAAGAGASGTKVAAADYGLTSALYGRRTLRLGLKLNF